MESDAPQPQPMTMERVERTVEEQQQVQQVQEEADLAAATTAAAFGGGEGAGTAPVGLRQRYQQQRRELLDGDGDVATTGAQGERFDVLEALIYKLQTVVVREHRVGQQQGQEGRQELANVMEDTAASAATQLASLKEKMIMEFSDLKRQLAVGECLPPTKENIGKCVGLFIGQLIKLIWLLNKIFYWTVKILTNIIRRGVSWIPLGIGPVLDIMVLVSMVVLFILVYCNIITAVTAGIIPAKLIVGKLLYIMKLVVKKLASSAAGVLQHIGTDIVDIAHHADVNVTHIAGQLRDFAVKIGQEAGTAAAGAAEEGVKRAASAAGGSVLHAAGSAIGTVVNATSNAIGTATNYIGEGLGLCGVGGCFVGGRRRKTRRRRRRKRTRRKRKKRKSKRKTKRRRRRKKYRKRRGRRTKRRTHPRRKSHKGGREPVLTPSSSVLHISPFPVKQKLPRATVSQTASQAWEEWTMEWKKLLVKEQFTKETLLAARTEAAEVAASTDTVKMNEEEKKIWEEFFDFQRECLQFLLGDDKNDGFILSVITSVVDAAAAAATAESQKDCKIAPCYYNNGGEEAVKYLNDTYSYSVKGGTPITIALNEALEDVLQVWLPKGTAPRVLVQNELAKIIERLKKRNEIK